MARSSHWSERLRRALEDVGWTAADLSRHTGLGIERVHKMVQGKVDNPRDNAIDLMAKALGTTTAYLQNGVVMDGLGASAAVPLNRIPVFNAGDIVLVGKVKSHKRTIAAPPDVSKTAFGFIVPDGALVSDGIHKGDIVVAEETANPTPGKVVVAIVGKPARGVARKYRPKVDGKSEGAELYAPQSDFPPIVMKKSDRVAGEAVYHIRKL